MDPFERMAFIVTTETIDELNELLMVGWGVDKMCPMGVGGQSGSRAAAIVYLIRPR